MTLPSSPGDPTQDRSQPPEVHRWSPAVWRRRILRWALTLVLLGLITWLILGNLTEMSSVTTALGRVGPANVVALLALLVLWRLLVASQLALTVRGLGLARSVVADESSASLSNIVPGPSGSGTRLMMLRSWGSPRRSSPRASR